MQCRDVLQRPSARALHTETTAFCSASWRGPDALVVRVGAAKPGHDQCGGAPTPPKRRSCWAPCAGLSALRIQNDTAAVKMAPMHCLASLPLLQVPRSLII